MSDSCLNTYSIVGHCRRSGELGAAVASAVPAVGAICLYLVPRVGAVSTQSWTNPYLATAVLEHLQNGMTVTEAIHQVLEDDPAANLRQIGVVHPDSGATAWTGSDCTAWCGQRIGRDYAAQGNMLTGPEVIAAMADAFETSEAEPLYERLMLALEAAQHAGGDKRGRQSAALKVVDNEVYGKVDLRVDEHADPITELRRVLEIARVQLLPFIDGMPRRDEQPAPAPAEVVNMLLKSPPDRTGGGGSAQP